MAHYESEQNSLTSLIFHYCSSFEASVEISLEGIHIYLLQLLSCSKFLQLDLPDPCHLIIYVFVASYYLLRL